MKFDPNTVHERIAEIRAERKTVNPSNGRWWETGVEEMSLTGRPDHFAVRAIDKLPLEIKGIAHVLDIAVPDTQMRLGVLEALIGAEIANICTDKNVNIICPVDSVHKYVSESILNIINHALENAKGAKS